MGNSVVTIVSTVPLTMKLVDLLKDICDNYERERAVKIDRPCMQG